MSDEVNFDPNLGRVIDVDIEKEMKKSFLDYSMSVIVSRALPDVRDGLKPVHRRILYTMWENGLLYDRPHHKCADTVGKTLSDYHPHGDSSVYDALVRLAQDFSLRYPLVDGHGNFGSVDGDPAAHYRYTEARMSKISMEMLTNINNDTVDFKMNFDDRKKEPTVLPCRFPNLLVNGSSGIAVGMATNIPSHNLNEVIDAIFLLIEDEETPLPKIMEKIKGPDFPTGGIIMGTAGIKAAYALGRGKITVRCRAEIVQTKKGRNNIIITEIPYQVNKAKLVETIAHHVKNKVIDGIVMPRDESGRDGMRIVIELKKDANPEIVLNKLYKYTQLQDTFGIINLALVDGVPKVLTLKEMLVCYINHQKEIVIRRTKFFLKKAEERAHILEGLKIALDYIDEVIKIIRSSENVNVAKENLVKRFALDEIQADAIVKMRLGQLSGLEREKIELELEELLNKIKDYNDILTNSDRVKKILIEELTTIKQKFGDERRTQIMQVEGEVEIEDLIPEHECVVTLTHYGYVKRQPANIYKIQKRGGRGVSGMKRRDEDFVEDLFIGSSHDKVVFITNKGLMYCLKCYEIPQSGRNSKGTNIVNLLNLGQDEKITNMFCVKEFTKDLYLVFVTKKGLIKRTRLDYYKNIRKSGLIALSLTPGDWLVTTSLTKGEDELIVATKKGMAIRFKEEKIRPLSRTAKGVIVIKLKLDDEVIGMVKLEENALVLTISSTGRGKRTKPEEYKTQNRGGFGILNYRASFEKGFVVAIETIKEDEDLIIISKAGIIIRVAANEISTMSRYAAGVKIMNLKDDDLVAKVSKINKDTDEDIESDEEYTQ